VAYLAAESRAIDQPRGTQPCNIVLVVDDEDGIRAFVTAALRQAGFETAAAGDGREALETFHAIADRVVLVVLDVGLPGLSAAQVLRAMRAARPTLPALIISGYAAESARAAFQSLDRTAFLRKPFSIATLQAEVARMLATP